MIPGTSALDTVKCVASDLEVGWWIVKDSRVWLVHLVSRGARRLTLGCTRYHWPSQRRVFVFELGARVNRYLP